MQKENKLYRTLNKVDSALLLQMADIDNLPYDMIKELHAEICVRREPGWKTIEASLRTRYRTARQKELDQEISYMVKLSEVFEPDTGAVLADLVTDSSKRTKQTERTVAVAPSSVLQPRVHLVQPPKPPTPSKPATWEDAAKLVRHAKVHSDVKDLDGRLKDSRNWAQISPLRLLGYSVNATDGLNLSDRREFLKDFCENAILPIGLPTDYATTWDEPGTKNRVLRTGRHLQFLVKTFKQQNNKSYDAAIAAWEQDWTYLREQFGRLANVSEWLATRN